MKKTTILCVAALALSIVAACDKAVSVLDEQEEAQVTIRFSPYEIAEMRSPVAIATFCNRLDVWIIEGNDTVAVHQTTEDGGFGEMEVTLNRTKTYTLYAVAHKADGATLQDGMIAFTDDKVTHAMWYTTTFTPATTTSINAEMSRIVAQFSFSTTDAVPDNVTKMRFTIADVYDRWNVTSGGTHQLDRVTTFSSFTKKNDGTAGFAVYAITTDAETLHDITVTAMDADDQPIQQRTFTDVPLRNGYKTQYRGTFFTDTAFSASFTVDDWSAYDVVDF